MRPTPTEPWSRLDLPPPDDQQPSRYGTEPKLPPTSNSAPKPTDPQGSPGGLDQ